MSGLVCLPALPVGGARLAAGWRGVWRAGRRGAAAGAARSHHAPASVRRWTLDVCREALARLLRVRGRLLLLKPRVKCIADSLPYGI